MSDKNDLTKLREQAADISGKIDRIEAVSRFNESVKLIGKCFRYRNSYSCPKSEADYWWMYSRVLMSSKDGWLTVYSFQKDDAGKVEIETRTRMCGVSLGEPITLKQFQHAWKVLANTINNQARNARALAP